MRTAPKQEPFPRTVSIRECPGITAKIYQQTREKPIKNGKAQVYTSFTLAYSLLGKRKLESFADLDEAEEAGKQAIIRIANGQQAGLELTGRDRDIYLRAVELVKPFGKDLDFVAQEWVDTVSTLNGAARPAEAARDYKKHNSQQLPRITVPDAVKKCVEQCRADKSKERMHQIEYHLNMFANHFNIEVHELTAGLVSNYLTGLALSNRTKKNARNEIGAFGRWLVLHGYFERGTNLLENVQTYSAKSGKILIFSPDEIVLLLKNAPLSLRPYIAIGAFAGLRGAELQRLDWSEIDLVDGFVEVKAEKAKTDTRRLVPITHNLRAWLNVCSKKSGPVCPYRNVVNQLMKVVATINKKLPKNTPEKKRFAWKKNALRHSYISYRVAECADIPRVADESGNSVAVIKRDYLKRVKPDSAAEYFSILPNPSGKPIVGDGKSSEQ